MAIGDLKVKLANVSIRPGKNVEAFYRVRVEPKAGVSGPGRNVSLTIPWDKFWALLTPTQKTALTAINQKVMQYGKENVDEIKDAIEE